MIAAIIFGVIGLALLSISVFAKGDDKIFPFIYGLLTTIGVLVILIAFFWDGSYEKGQKDVLKGVQNYEIQHVYRMNDTIPVDTIYVKIK